MAEDRDKPIRNVHDFMRRFLPKEYERRVKEGRCIHCGAKKPDHPFSKVHR